MSLFESLNEDVKKAMKAGEKEKVGIYRMLLSEVKKAAIDQMSREEISDELVILTLTKSVKSRKESVEQYRAAGRDDLASKEEMEIEIISTYLPNPLSEEEIAGLVAETIAEVQAEGKKDMGKVMKAVMPKVQGRADGKKVKQVVLEKLG